MRITTSSLVRVRRTSSARPSPRKTRTGTSRVPELGRPPRAHLEPRICRELQVRGSFRASALRQRRTSMDGMVQMRPSGDSLVRSWTDLSRAPAVSGRAVTVEGEVRPMIASGNSRARAESRTSTPGAATVAGALSPVADDDSMLTAALALAKHEAMLGTDVAGTLEWCVVVGRRAPLVGDGQTKRLWELLAGVAMRNVSAARMLEPHLDALSILHQAGTDLFRHRDPWELERVAADGDSSWGVFAAESGDVRLRAYSEDGGWVLRGTKPWCSLADHVSH